MTVFRVSIGNPKRAVCSHCGTTQRIWSQQQVAKWKREHANTCPANERRTK